MNLTVIKVENGYIVAESAYPSQFKKEWVSRTPEELAALIKKFAQSSELNKTPAANK